MTADVPAFLFSREWQLQPIYLAAHLITLRLFATMFTRNFLAGVVHLDMPPADARRGIRLVQGPVVRWWLADRRPFCLYDYQILGFAKGGPRAARRVGPSSSCSTACGASSGS